MGMPDPGAFPFRPSATGACIEIVFLHVCASCVKKINIKDAIVATVNKRLSSGAAG
jgi:hypothetical protein